MTKIKFGTDGWRAIIAEEYTTCNVARVSIAVADWLIENNKSLADFYFLQNTFCWKLQSFHSNAVQRFPGSIFLNFAKVHFQLLAFSNYT